MKKQSVILILLLIFAGLACFIYLSNYFGGKNYSNKVVNIVFTTDMNYKNYLKTTIRSAIANKRKDSVYNINILCVDLPQSEREKFKTLESENVNINPIPLSLEAIKDVGNYKISYNVTRADLFKFFMPELFPNLDKILYIDADTIIIGDLTKLYNTDIRKKYLGVVDKCLKTRETGILYNRYRFSKKIRKYNCGVLLYNLKLWRKHDITKKLVEVKNKGLDRRLMTQNVFNNVLTSDKVKHLSPVYNIFVQWDTSYFKGAKLRDAYFPYCITDCSFDDFVKRGVIIHYLDDNKPWNYRKKSVSKYWLQYEKREDYE